MPRIGHDAELRLRPARREIEGTDDRTDHVIAAVDDHGGNMTDAVDIVEQLRFRPEEASIHKIMSLDAREGWSETIATEKLLALRVGEQRARRAFPGAG